MNVSEFVSKSLQQIVEGVTQADAAIQKIGGAVNPGFGGKGSEGPRVKRGPKWIPVQDVQFDMAVTTTSEEGVEGGLRITAAVLNVGGGTDSTTGETAVSHLRFTVPLVLPPAGRADEHSTEQSVVHY